jgi:CSLREA domain-containing protein
MTLEAGSFVLPAQFNAGNAMKTNGYRTFSLIFALAVVAATFGSARPTRAAGPYTVNSTLDEPDATVGDGICASTPSGVCTLRAAIMEANFNFTPDTIILPASAQPYQITRAGGDNTALNGDLDVTTPITLTGGGAANTIIDGGDLDRVFQVINVVTFNVSGVTIRNGHATSGGAGIFSSYQDATLVIADSVVTSNDAQFGYGGGIYSAGVMTMTNTIVSDNHVLDSAGAGGGIYVPYTYGVATINNSLIIGNTDAGVGGGGGIHNSGTMTLNETVVTGNSASSAYAAGGIENYYGVLTLNHSTVSDNQATGQYADAGGLVNLQGTLYLNNSTVSGNQVTHALSTGAGGLYLTNEQGGLAVLTNSTVSGNSSHDFGGGIQNDGFGVLYLRNSTIAYNRADSDDSEHGLLVIMGGGIANYGTAYTRNTIIANNVRGDQANEVADDCNGTLQSQGNNLVGVSSGCTLNADNGTSKQNMAANLGPLAYNGGTTMTHVLLAGSPAIDSGNASGCKDNADQDLTTDQRGFSRVVDGDGVGGARCDIGAFELTQAFYQVFVPVATH